MSLSETNRCLACGSEIKFWGESGKHQISVCSRCGLGITDNPNIQTEKYHRDSVYQQEGSQFKNIFQRRVKIIDSLHLKAGKVLEIGSSTGLLLSLLKEKGWDVTGVEISPDAAEYAEKRGVKTLQTSFEKLDLPSGLFDMVIINHTLEHLQETEQVLRKIHGLLKEEGVLLVDVPNFGSFSAKVFKTQWFALLPGEHLWHFTFPALSKLLQSSGFKVLRRTSPSGIWDYGNPLLEVFQSLLGMKKRFFNNVLTAVPNLAVTLLNEGSTLTVVARKVNR